MDGGLTPERPLNSNLFYRPLPTGPANFNIRTDATALTRGRTVGFEEEEEEAKGLE